jgi:drug/metabolite transporter (DMT)-like permease
LRLAPCRAQGKIMASAATWLGIGAAVVAAVCQTATDIGTKAATREADERLVVAVQWCVGAVLLSALCLVLHPELVLRPWSAAPELMQGNFWPLLISSTALNVAAYYSFVRAYRLSEASLVAPLLLVTPVLMLVTSPILVDQRVSALGAGGVILSVAGGLVLASSEPGARPRASLMTFLRDPGVRAMALTAAIYSVTANMDKLGVEASTPIVWIAVATDAIALSSVALLLVSRPRPFRLGELRFALAAGAALAVGNATQMFALTLLFVPYVIALKRMSALLTVIVGGLALGENFRTRLLGAGIMFAGAVLVILARE